MSSTANDSIPKRIIASFLRWFDTSTNIDKEDSDKVDWVRVLPFVGLHLACIGVIWVGFSWFAFWVAVGLYVIRMFAITGFYHRYFSHKAFRTSRPVQFIFAFIGASSVQRGPLWWAAHHRHHHLNADKPDDAHSPIHGFWRSHMGWFLTSRGFKTNFDAIKDLVKFPELRWLDRFDILVPVMLATFLFVLGGWLKKNYPELNTNGPQLLIWGFFISTIVLFHITVTINSLAHVWGTRRYNTKDNSRNNALLALLTFGEGWHNNHHYFPGAARQGFRWWEYDFTYYTLRVLSLFRIVWDLKPVPANLKRGAV